MSDNDSPGTALNRFDQRQQDRLNAICKKEGWPPRLPFDLAMQMEEPGEVLARYNLTTDDGVRLLQNPTFVSVMRVMREEIVHEGTSFKQKARLAAEELLIHAYEIATDAEAPAAVRADLIKWHAKVAGLEPTREAGGEGGGGGPVFKLEVTFAGTLAHAALEGSAQRVTDADVIESVKTLETTDEGKETAAAIRSKIEGARSAAGSAGPEGEGNGSTVSTRTIG